MDIPSQPNSNDASNSDADCGPDVRVQHSVQDWRVVFLCLRDRSGWIRCQVEDSIHKSKFNVLKGIGFYGLMGCGAGAMIWNDRGMFLLAGAIGIMLGCMQFGRWLSNENVVTYLLEGFARQRILPPVSRIEVRYRLSRLGVHAESAVSEWLVRWEATSHVVDTATHVVFIWQYGDGLAIPRASFSSARDAQRFVECARHLHAAHGVTEAERLTKRFETSSEKCPSCAYPLRGTRTDKCPECGRPLSAIELDYLMNKPARTFRLFRTQRT